MPDDKSLLTKSDLVFAVRNRGQSELCTADHYLKALQACLDGSGPCDLSLADVIKGAADKATYSSDKMVVGDFATKGAALTPGSIMDFDCIITATVMDRDKDILESSGARLDPAAPLLMFHNPELPIGRLVSKTEHNAQRLCGRFSILDTTLGRDAAVLVEGGGVRISHGFDPDDDGFEPLKGGRFHILKYAILEVSLVPVPSCTAAVITSYSRNKLHSPFVKSWAKSLFDARPAQSSGVETIVVNGKTYIAQPNPCHCGGNCVGECKSHDSVITKESPTHKDTVPMSTEQKPADTKDNSVPSSPPRVWQDGERAIPQAIQQGDSEWPNRHPPAVVWDYALPGVDAFDVLAPTANDLTWSIATGGIPGPQRNPAPPDASLIAPGLSQEVATPTPTDGSSNPKPSDPGFAPGPQRSADPTFLKAVEDSISLNLRKIRATLLMAFKAGVSDSAAKEIGKLFDMAGVALKQIAGQSPPVGLPSPMQYPVGSGSMVDNPAGSSMMPVPSNNATNAGNINYFLSIVGPNGNNAENVNAFYSIPVANNLNTVSMTGTGGMLPNTIQANPPTGSTSQTQRNSNNGAIYSYPGGTGSGSSPATSYPNTGGVGSAAAALPNTMQSNPPTGGKTAKDWNGVAVDYPPVGDPIGDGSGPPLTNTGRIDPGMKENVADPNISGSLYSPPVDVQSVGSPPPARIPGTAETSFSGVTEKEVADWLNDSNENTVKAGVAEAEEFESWLMSEALSEA